MTNPKTRGIRWLLALLMVLTSCGASINTTIIAEETSTPSLKPTTTLPAAGRLDITVHYPNADIGVEMGWSPRLTVQVNDEQGKAVDNAQVSVTVSDPRGQVAATLPATPGGSGIYRTAPWMVPHRSEEGHWKLMVEAKTDHSRGHGSSVFPVKNSASETLLASVLNNLIRPRPALLSSFWYNEEVINRMKKQGIQLTGIDIISCIPTTRSTWPRPTCTGQPEPEEEQPLTEHSGYERSARLYDLFDQKENIEFFYHYAKESGEILDIGAGTGRIAIPMARRGIKVWGVEPSPAMRREFEGKLQQEAALWERIVLVEGKAESFSLGRRFPAAILSGCFDHLLNDGERLAALENIHRHLLPGGMLVFDVFLGLMGDSPLTPAGSVQAGTQQIRRLVGGRLLPRNIRETQLVFEIYEGEELVERFEERSLVGITNRRAIHRLLDAAGFEVKQEWGQYDFTPFRDGDTLLIVEAVKTGGDRWDH
jgi:SAM-dependent methyltransferase